jgi:hypothetical protein
MGELESNICEEGSVVGTMGGLGIEAYWLLRAE